MIQSTESVVQSTGSVRKFPDITSSLLDHQSSRLDQSESPGAVHPVYWTINPVDWISLHMAPTMYIVYLRFNGEIIYGQHGAEYQGSQMKFIRVRSWEVISPHINYMTLLITDDDGVNLMFDMLDATPELKGIELYISVEDCVGEGVEPLTQDDGDGLVAEDCVGEDVQQMTVHDTAPSTQPSTLGRCTPQLHEIRTSVEDCGPSTRHEYVPYEVNPLAGVHDTMMLECTADDEEENADYDNDSYFDDDDDV
uniref:Uncharacterized protein n=1 Tax=Fagus sylvatica TaxID=28930 RepID=A0A2N9I4V5_FAGSY